MIYVEPHKELDPNPSYPWSTTKLLPIIHPAAIIRSWDLRAPTMHDLSNRVRQARHNDWRRTPTPTFIWNPSFAEATSRLRHWLQAAEHHEVTLASDIETLSRRFISCMGFSDGPNFALTIPFLRPLGKGDWESYWTLDQEAELIGLIRRLLSHPSIRIVGQNYIYDTQYIQHWFGVTPNLHHDTMLAQNVLFPGTPKDLGHLSSLYCDYHWYWKDDEKDYNTIDERLLSYNCEDCVRTFEIATNQLKYIESVGQQDQMRFKMQTNQLCLRMMNRGILIDKARAGSMFFQLEAFQTAVYQELLEIIPQDWVQPLRKKTDKPWYRSAKQTAEVFYDILGFSVVNHKKTGNRTVGKEALAVLERKYPEFTGLFRRLDYAGSVSNTMNVIKTPVEADGRMRCSYNPGGTETHRLSSSENVFGRGTNLQNLTKGEEDE
jgi:DNA polymerase I-like protein with 3'-5' exonuclease and polymerase domains